jgi:CheY-like chemotaxis protein
MLVMRNLLKKKNFEVIEAVDGDMAWTSYLTAKVELIFMDVQLPKRNGYELTQIIREHENAQNLPLTPIIALTANAHADDKARCLAAGMTDYVAKPFQLADIERVLHSYLREKI